MEKKPYLDEFFARIISRKFLVWSTATVLMLVSVQTKFTVLTSSDWVTISVIYIGGQTVIDAAIALKTGSTSRVGNIQQNITNTNNSTVQMQVPSSSKEVIKNIQKDKDNEKETDRQTLPGNEDKK